MQDDRVYSHSFFSPNQSSIYALYVEETGIQRCFAGQQWGPESREYFILLQVLSGKGRIQIGQKTYPAVPNDVFLFYPGDHVCYYSDQSAPLEYTWVGFKGGDAQMLLAQTEFSHLKPMLHFPGDVPFSNDLQELYTYHGSRAVDSVRMIACLYRFFGDLLEGAQKKKIKGNDYFIADRVRGGAGPAGRHLPVGAHVPCYTLRGHCGRQCTGG